MPKAFQNPPSALPQRWAALAVAFACFAPLVLGALLRPSAEGHGTHRQLGLPPCGWAMALDAPCPTCGMTTAFAWAGEGQMAESFRTQPAGFALAVLAAAAGWGALHVAIGNVRVGSALRGLWRGPTIAAAVALFLLAWGFKALTW